MKIAIQANPSRGKEIISLLESLGGINDLNLDGSGITAVYYIGDNNIMQYSNTPKDYKVYTLEEFKKEFPFKVGDRVVTIDHKVYKIIAFEYYNNKLCYTLDNGFHYIPQILKPYKEMKEERNVTLTLEKAKEWYKKGGELKEIALQAFTEKELTKIDLPKTWKEFCENYPVQEGECWLASCDEIHEKERAEKRIYKNWISSKKSAEAHLAMIQLEQLRNCWWGDWKPEWNASHKYTIKNLQGEIAILGCSNVATFLVFPTRKMAEEFLKCFRDLIEQAGDLI